MAQPISGDHILFGDLTVNEQQDGRLKPLTFDVLLYSEGAAVLILRQTVPANGRYRFNNLTVGAYVVVIELEAQEIARVEVDVRSPLLKDVRRDIALEWRSSHNLTKAGLLSVTDNYVRTPERQRLFKLANDASAKKQYAEAAQLLQRIVTSDKQDFQAWTELANNHFLEKRFGEAENEYLHALDAHPGFFLALLNLGRLEVTLKKYDVAAEALRQAAKLRPESPDANYWAGEAYLQLKKGSVAVPYLTEAVRLDPDGMAEVHLRLAALYHAAGLRDKAAAEYEQFLNRRPDYRDRKRLEKYIAENRKRA